MAEWIQAAQVLGAAGIAYLGGRRTSQATEKSAQTSAETLSLSYVFKELENVRNEAREAEKLHREKHETLSKKCDELTTKAETLQQRVYVLEQEKQTTSLEHQRELDHRDREVEKLQELLEERELRMRRMEETQKALIAFIETNYKCDEDKLLIGTAEIVFKDKFSERAVAQAQSERQVREEKEQHQ